MNLNSQRQFGGEVERAITVMMSLPLNLAMAVSSVFADSISQFRAADRTTQGPMDHEVAGYQYRSNCSCNSNPNNSNLDVGDLNQPEIYGQHQNLCRANQVWQNIETAKTQEKTMSNNSCETVRMIRYKIVFIREGFEAVLYEEQVVVSADFFDCGASFEVQKTAEFFQKPEVEIPNAWISGYENDGTPILLYPPEEHRVRDGYFKGIPEEDKKYLRFFQEEEATFERRKDSEVHVLRDIQKQLKEGINVHKQKAAPNR